MLNNLKTTTILMLTILLSSQLVLAESVNSYSQEVQAINRADQNQDYRGVYYQARSLLFRVYQDLDVNRVVRRINSGMTEVINETVTERHSESSGFNASASLFTIFLNGSFNHSEEKENSWDVTKLISQNPRAVSQFSQKSRRDFTRLQGELNQYVQANVAKILLLKEAAIKVMEASTQLTAQQATVSAQELQRMADMATEVSFLGQHSVTRCTRVNYANRSRRESANSQTSAGASLFFFSISGEMSSNQESTSNYYAHSQTNCKSSQSQASVNLRETSTHYDVNLSMVDHTLEGWIRHALGVSLYTIEPIEIPDWGNPYFN